MASSWKKNTALFLASQLISLLGSSLVDYAIMWHITLKTGSGMMTTIYILCNHLPSFFMSLFGGVWADRYDRRRLAALADSSIAAFTLALAVVFLLGYREIWLLFVISAIRALGSGVHSPCVSAMLPQLVPEDKLARINAVRSSMQSVMLLASPALSGLLLSVAPLEVIFFVDVVTASIAVPVLLAIRLPGTPKKGVPEGGYFDDLRKGWRYIRSHAFVWAFIVFYAVFHILIVPVALLTPLQVKRTFSGDVWHLTAIELAFSAGMVLGGLGMTVWSGFKNRATSMIVACCVLGVLTVALGVVSVFPVYLTMMALMGLLIPLYQIPMNVLIQERVEADYLGRVFGVLGMVGSLTVPLGMLGFGPLADAVSIEWLLIVTGVLMALEALLLRRNRAVMEAGKPKLKPGKAPQGIPERAD